MDMTPEKTMENSITIVRAMGWSPRQYNDDTAWWGKMSEPITVIQRHGAHAGPEFRWNERHSVFVRIEDAMKGVINDRPLTPFDDQDLETYWHLLPDLYLPFHAHYALQAIRWGCRKFKEYRNFIAENGANTLMFGIDFVRALDVLASEEYAGKVFKEFDDE